MAEAVTRIMYLAALEQAFYSGIIESQVFPLLQEIGRKLGKGRVLFVALVPLRLYMDLRNPWPSIFIFRRKRKEIRERLRLFGVSVFFHPLLFPFKRKYFYMTIFHLTVFLPQAFLLVCYYVINYRVRMIHSRSYPASLLAFLCHRFLKIPYIFDMKGAYPEEAVAHGVFSSSSVNFRIWKWIERRLVVDAKRVIVVSVPFYEHVRGLAASKNVSVIPCCVDLNRVKYDEEMRRTVRKRFGLEESFVLLYSGSLGPVYDSSLIAEYFAHFKSFIDTAFLLILTNRESSPVAESHLRERGIATDDYLILNPQPDEIAHLTLIGSAGLLFLKPFDFNKIALSIKFGEYLASGLPVIVNSHAGGAADLVAKHRCGIVVNSVNCRDFGQEEWLLQNYDRIRDRGFDLVEKHLSVQTCVRKYLSAYGKQASQMSTLE